MDATFFVLIQGKAKRRYVPVWLTSLIQMITNRNWIRDIEIDSAVILPTNFIDGAQKTLK